MTSVPDERLRIDDNRPNDPREPSFCLRLDKAQFIVLAVVHLSPLWYSLTSQFLQNLGNVLAAATYIRADQEEVVRIFA